MSKIDTIKKIKIEKKGKPQQRKYLFSFLLDSFRIYINTTISLYVNNRNNSNSDKNNDNSQLLCSM